MKKKQMEEEVEEEQDEEDEEEEEAEAEEGRDAGLVLCERAACGPWPTHLKSRWLSVKLPSPIWCRMAARCSQGQSSSCTHTSITGHVSGASR